mmetsp:Transcript_13382/g.41399  ORF Transcript_13382/g.41399 Transcript_13382/m.41399 type:complete len:237 (-) Transcript_13382:152-862(-)
MQRRRLDFQEALVVEEAPDPRRDLRAELKRPADVGVRDEVELALPVARLDVGEAPELIGQRRERLREHVPVVDVHRQLALLRALGRAGRADDVARVDPVEEVLERLGAVIGHVAVDALLLEEELDLARRVAEAEERELLAEDALRHDAAPDGQPRALLFLAVLQVLPLLLRLRRRVRRLVRIRERVHARRAHRVGFREPRAADLAVRIRVGRIAGRRRWRRRGAGEGAQQRRAAPP